MRLFSGILFKLLCFCISPSLLFANEYINHDIHITLVPESGVLKVRDSITITKKNFNSSGKIHFLLHSGLSPTSTTPGVRVELSNATLSPKDFFIAPETLPKTFDVPVEHYVITLPPNKKKFVITYKGPIKHRLDHKGSTYSGRPGGTPGLISEKGVFLDSGAFWYPWFNNDLFTFTLETVIPIKWEIISQGERTLHIQTPQGKTVRWESPEPQKQIHVVGGELTEYIKKSGPLVLYAFLRSPDPELANRYLSVSEKYLTMYSELIGMFPYKKFALVENFWETGYGMPSFTLLGSKVIRLPFILHSSYPHEILHNWWGNSIYVDYSKGNWSEGLTTYLADHLIKEQKRKGKEYRKSLLQKYTDFVPLESDFPLTEFRSRTSQLTQAIGYGKTAMMFHMLRRTLGDGLFIELIQRLYFDNLFKEISFPQIRDLLLEAGDSDAIEIFDQSVTRTSAASLEIGSVTVDHESDGYTLNGLLKQTQTGPAYMLNVPIAIYMKDRLIQTTIPMRNKFKQFSQKLPAFPLRIDVDPEFDLFRRLDREEIPPALSQAFGAEKILILIPARSRPAILKAFMLMAEKWKKSYPGKITIKMDEKINEIPNDSAIWILGWENRFMTRIVGELQDYGIDVNKRNIKIKGRILDRWENSFVVSSRNPLNQKKSLVWVASENTSAIEGLSRKIPHYSKYSYLGFEGNGPKNIMKGIWQPKNSPLTIMIPPKFGVTAGINNTTLAPRNALIDYPAE